MEDLILRILVTIEFIVLGCLFAYSIIVKNRNFDQLSKKEKEKLQAEQSETARKLIQLNEEYNAIKVEYDKEFQHLQEVTKELQEKEQFNKQLYEIRVEELDNLIEVRRKAELEKLSRDIDEWLESAQEAATLNSTQLQEELKAKIAERVKELDDLEISIKDYKARRDVINQEILRARAIEEQQDFYRIQLPESSKHDLEILQSIRKELTKVDILDKLLYDNYIKKSVDEMVKRVLKGENPSGIYKITRLKTGEIYIGKSVNVKDRWVQHAKSVFHCGTISHSILHTTIEKDGIENFTWELLEEIPKDKLGEREKYWIEFYDSKNFGLNERQG